MKNRLLSSYRKLHPTMAIFFARTRVPHRGFRKKSIPGRSELTRVTEIVPIYSIPPVFTNIVFKRFELLSIDGRIFIIFR